MIVYYIDFVCFINLLFVSTTQKFFLKINFIDVED